jgi:membrane protein YqaA with SNARE-associated domain
VIWNHANGVTSLAEPIVAANEEAGASGLQPRWIEWLDGKPGLALAFFWGIAEGTFFFVVPDVVISLAALVRPRRAWRHVVAAIVGAVLGGALLFHWASQSPGNAQNAVAQVPFVTPQMFARVQEGYRAHGLGAVFRGPLTGTPYKIYAVEAPEFVGRTAFLAATVPARGERFLLAWIAFGVAGAALRRYLGRTTSQLATRHAFFWILFYAFYWTRIAFR